MALGVGPFQPQPPRPRLPLDAPSPERTLEPLAKSARSPRRHRPSAIAAQPFPELPMPPPKPALWTLCLGCALFLSACAGAGANAESDARLVIGRWATAFKDSDLDTIVSLYAPDASFFGT